MQPIETNDNSQRHLLESMFSRLIADADWLQSEQQETPPARQVHAEPTFTLSQIVEYCKGRVVWEDARPIVAMLNTLLRGYASREDFEQVDSIETEFRQRTYGNVFQNSQITMPGAHFHGAMYEISGNQKVNMGGNQNEQ